MMGAHSMQGPRQQPPGGGSVSQWSGDALQEVRVARVGCPAAVLSVLMLNVTVYMNVDVWNCCWVHFVTTCTLAGAVHVLASPGKVGCACVMWTGSRPRPPALSVAAGGCCANCMSPWAPASWYLLTLAVQLE